MSRRLLTILGFGSFLLLGASTVPVAEELLKSSDHESMGKAIAEYIKSYEQSKGVDKALEGVSDQLEKFHKKTKKDPLSLGSDLGRSLWASFDYDKKMNGLKKGGVKDMSMPRPLSDDPKATLTYSLWLPVKYDPKKEYPLLMLVPDKGQKLTDLINEKWSDPAIRDGAILVAVPMPSGDSTDSWLQMASITSGTLTDGGLSNVLATMGDLRKLVAIDYDRVYLAGWGEGVRVVALLGARFPDRFAGIIGRSGDPQEGLTIEMFKNLPTFFAGAGQGATSFSEKITAAKYENCTVMPEAKEPEVWAWIQDHPRISNPLEVVLSAPARETARAYWVALQQFDSPIELKATIDRGTNTITIDGEGATQVTLYFNDVIVDLDKEVKVICNGTEHLEKIPRSQATFLNLIWSGRSDPGKLYVAQRPYDLPPKPKPKTKPPPAK